MLRAKRDKLAGQAGNAVPTLGETGGRIFVLRAIALTALARLLKRYDADGQAELITALRRGIGRKCEQANLPEADISTASQYAEELFEGALRRVRKAADSRPSDAER